MPFGDFTKSIANLDEPGVTVDFVEVHVARPFVDLVEGSRCNITDGRVQRLFVSFYISV